VAFSHDFCVTITYHTHTQTLFSSVCQRLTRNTQSLITTSLACPAYIAYLVRVDSRWVVWNTLLSCGKKYVITSCESFVKKSRPLYSETHRCSLSFRLSKSDKTRLSGRGRRVPAQAAEVEDRWSTERWLARLSAVHERLRDEANDCIREKHSVCENCHSEREQKKMPAPKHAPYVGEMGWP